MLRPYIIAVCEKVVLDAKGIASLIAVFSDVEVKPMPGSPATIPANAVAPKEWAVFTSWDLKPEDAPKKFRQFLKVLYPDGTVWVDSPLEFTTEVGKDHHQVIGNFNGFPIGQQGTYKITVRLEQDGATLFESPAIAIKVKHQ